jgi:hypothetical protein
MKKLMVLVMFSFLLLNAEAQLSFGPKAGLNIAKLTISNTTDYTYGSVVRFYGGGFANYKLSDQFAAQIEILYSGEGEKGKILANGATDNIKIGFLNIPILFQYISPFGIYAETGPQAGFLLSITEATGNNASESIKQYYKSLNFSWDFGLGYKLEKYVPGLGINARYALGFGAINKDAISGGSLKSRLFSVGLFYALQLKNITKTK